MQSLEEHTSISIRSLLPSSLISLSVHVIVIITAGLTMRGCDNAAPSASGGQDFREIGLAFVNDSSDAVSDIAAQNPHDTEDVRPSVPDPQLQQQPVVPTEVPNVSELMNQSQSTSDATAEADSQFDFSNTIGPGRPISGVPEIGGGLSELIRPQGNSGSGSAGSLTPGPGETAFMDIVGKGRSFVYVIDTSSSMAHDQRLDLAASQLKRSLRLLEPYQQFQVLFYNQVVTPINLRSRPFKDSYPATKVNVQLAVQAIDMQQPFSGTSHLPAIQRAMLLRPDVIYFLTDGETGGLDAAELRKLRRANRGTEIHVIVFAGTSRESQAVSWLETMARDSGGQYRRIMVK